MAIIGSMNRSRVLELLGVLLVLGVGTALLVAWFLVASYLTPGHYSG